MIQLATSLMEHSPLAALIALEPMSYVIRTLFFIAAFSSAMKIESVVGRADHHRQWTPAGRRAC
ncbi:MAG: hypothetical protein EOP85_11515 [Verrucomicrobiaceae bacterium]|nr:MAG: hypothetical protein EOP85_11515 [Verrucomicrobiaceae bacterium]